MLVQEIKHRSLGSFYSRPLEIILERLTENFKMSQPLHVRHLAIIKDVAQVGRTPHYQYYSYGQFERLVAAGSASWDVVSGASKKGAANKSTGTANTKDGLEPDEHGFCRLRADQFLAKDGAATLLEGVLAVKAESIVFSGADPILRRRDDGSFGLSSSPVRLQKTC